MKTLRKILEKCPHHDLVWVVYRNEKVLVNEIQLRYLQTLVKKGKLSSNLIHVEDPKRPFETVSFMRDGVLNKYLKSNTLSLGSKLAFELF